MLPRLENDILGNAEGLKEMGEIMADILKIKVRGYHCDFFRHVNHSRYPELLEEASWDYWDRRPELTSRLVEHRVDHAVVNLTINYRESATLGDTLRIETRLASAGRSSITFEHKVFNDATGRIVAEGEKTAAFFHAKTKEPATLDSEAFSGWVELGELLAD